MHITQRAAYYREMAEEARLHASLARDQAWKSVWLEIAGDWDRFADGLNRNQPAPARASLLEGDSEALGSHSMPAEGTPSSGRQREGVVEGAGRPSPILLIDDDDDLRLVLRYVLRDAGYAVDAVAGAAEARHRLITTAYDLVIADARLPDGNGVEIADEAKAKGMTAVILTGYDRQAAHHDYLFKPIRPDEFVLAVRQYIGLRKGNRPSS